MSQVQVVPNFFEDSNFCDFVPKASSSFYPSSTSDSFYSADFSELIHSFDNKHQKCEIQEVSDSDSEPPSKKIKLSDQSSDLNLSLDEVSTVQNQNI